MAGDNATRANAITFTGGTNSLTITSTSIINGTVQAFSTADTLGLGGSVDATFDLTQIGGGGQYRGFGVLQMSGSSIWTLTGTTSATLAYQANAGTLLVNGSLAVGSTTTVGANGSLGGSGAANGSVSVNGIISGGTFGGVGTLTTGALTLNSGSIFQDDIANPTSADLVRSNGVSLSGTTTLDLRSTGALPLTSGQSVTLIDNTASTAISGRFTNFTLNGSGGGAIANDDSFQANGRSYKISYVGGDGNNIVLTVQPTPTIVSDTLATQPGGTDVNAGTFTFTVAFDQAVTVHTGGSNANLSLALNNSRSASYSNISSDGKTLTFSYTVGANDDVADLKATGFNALQGGATIKSSSSVDADLSSNFSTIDTGTQIDTIAPTVQSINRASGAATTNNATSEVYTVTFSEAVTGVDANDFTLTTTGNSTATGTLAQGSVVAVNAVNGYATTYTVTATGVTGDGTLRLDLNASNTGITDKAGNAIATGFNGQAYTIDQVGPSISGVTLDRTSYKFGDTVTATIQLSGVYDGHGNYTLGAGSTLDGQTLTAGSYDTTNNRLTASFVAGASVTQVNNGTVLDNIAVSDAVGNISAASTASVAGITIDTIAPAVDTAKVNGNTLTLTYLEAGSGLYAGQNIATPAVGDYAVTVGNAANVVTGVAVDATAKTVTLTLTNAVTTSDVVTLAYTAGADPGALRDIAGNLAANLTAQTVTNITLPPPQGGGGGGGSLSSNVATLGPDRLVGTIGDDTISGLAGNDTISGDDGNDILLGNQGNDSIDAGSGNNTGYGGTGDDILSAGSGNDLIFGNEGADTINGGDGNNTLVGGQDSNDGSDLITAGSGNDLIFGNGGDDSIAAGAGNDIVVGGFGNDVLFGNQGNDLVYGNQGNDIIYGGMGDDTLIGGQGDDTLIGGEGNDVLYGNEGADRIVFGANSGNDLVMGFSSSEGDRLDLQGQTYALTQDINGNAVLTLSGGGMITLAGVAANQVSAGFFA